MTILVVYASRHAATQGIAERIAAKLRTVGHEADARPMKTVRDVTGYDAFVLGSAVYFGKWLKEAVAFAKQHQEALASRPVWLFSSGPLGTETTDTEGHDLREAAEPAELPGLIAAVRPRDHRVFFGALDPSKLSFTERVIHALPAGKKLLVEGDFRDWGEIEGWAESIASELAKDTVFQR